MGVEQVVKLPEDQDRIEMARQINAKNNGEIPLETALAAIDEFRKARDNATPVGEDFPWVAPLHLR